MTKLFSLLMAASGAVAVAARDEVQGQVEAPAKPVNGQAAERVPGVPVLRYSATTQADREMPLAFKVSGYVAVIPQRRGADGRSRPLQPGDAVRAGEVLARVRDADYRERVNQAADSVHELGAARIKAQFDLECAQTLFASESLTRPDLDAAQAAFDANEARMAAARALVELAEIALRDAALVAPTSGVVLERRIEVGTLVSAGAVGFVIGKVAS